MIVDDLVFSQGRIFVVRDHGWLVFLVCALEKEPTETVHAWRCHNRGGDAVDIASSTIGQIHHVRVVLEVVRHGVAATISALAEMVELNLRLMIDDRGVLSYLYSVALLIDCVDQAEGVAGRLKGIKSGPVSDFSSEVLVAAPHYGGENLT